MIAAHLDGFQTIGAAGGQVETGPNTQRPGCSGAIGFDAIAVAEAELDRRELALARLGGSTVRSEDKHTYCDILTRNIHNTRMHTTPLTTTATNRTTYCEIGVARRSGARPAAVSGASRWCNDDVYLTPFGATGAPYYE